MNTHPENTGRWRKQGLSLDTEPAQEVKIEAYFVIFKKYQLRVNPQKHTLPGGLILHQNLTC